MVKCKKARERGKDGLLDEVRGEKRR